MLTSFSFLLGLSFDRQPEQISTSVALFTNFQGTLVRDVGQRLSRTFGFHEVGSLLLVFTFAAFLCPRAARVHSGFSSSTKSITSMSSRFIPMSSRFISSIFPKVLSVVSDNTTSKRVN